MKRPLSPISTASKADFMGGSGGDVGPYIA